MPVRYNLSSVWVMMSIFSQLSIIQYVGLCVFSLPISFVMIERIYILCLIIIIKSEVSTITHCLGLGHETTVCTVCLSIFFWNLHAVKVNQSLYQLDILMNPFWFSFGHYHASIRKCLACVSYTIWKISLNSYSKNLSFEKADAYQSLLGIRFAAVAINRPRTLARVLHDDCDIIVQLQQIDTEIENEEQANSVVSMLLHWYCQIGFYCDPMIKICFKSFNISGDVTPCVYPRSDHLTQSTRSKVHKTVWVIAKVHTF